MYKTLLLFFLLLHMIGDYYLQSDSMADEKNANHAALQKHGLIYAAVFIALTAAVWNWPVLIAAAALAILHYGVDILKTEYLRKHTVTEPSDSLEAYTYCIDQGLHLLFLFAAVLLLKVLAVSAAAYLYCSTVCEFLPVAPFLLLRWVCLLAFLWKPANITIKVLTSKYKPAKNAQDSSKDKAGAFIGSLERMIILLLMSVGQYAAIGLVLTAKSVARYKKISEDQSFAEYYLLGTLLSTLLAIAAYFILILYL